MADEASPFNVPISITEPLPNEEVRERAALLLRQRERRILRSWVSHVGALPMLRERPQLGLDDVLGGIPAVLKTLADYLADPAKEELSLEHSITNDDAYGHGAARAAIGFAARDVIVEFLLFRQILWRELRSPVPEDTPDQAPLSAGEVAALHSFVNAYLDSLLAATISGWTQIATVVR